MRAGAWCGAQLTDGFVPEDMVAALGGNKGDTTKLVQSGLWDKAQGGYQFHDWDKYQPSSKKVREEQAKARARMRELRANADRNTTS